MTKKPSSSASKPRAAKTSSKQAKASAEAPARYITQLTLYAEEIVGLKRYADAGNYLFNSVLDAAIESYIAARQKRNDPLTGRPWRIAYPAPTMRTVEGSHVLSWFMQADTRELLEEAIANDPATTKMNRYIHAAILHFIDSKNIPLPDRDEAIALLSK